MTNMNIAIICYDKNNVTTATVQFIIRASLMRQQHKTANLYCRPSKYKTPSNHQYALLHRDGFSCSTKSSLFMFTATGRKYFQFCETTLTIITKHNTACKMIKTKEDLDWNDLLLPWQTS